MRIYSGQSWEELSPVRVQAAFGSLALAIARMWINTFLYSRHDVQCPTHKQIVNRNHLCVTTNFQRNYFSPIVTALGETHCVVVGMRRWLQRVFTIAMPRTSLLKNRLFVEAAPPQPPPNSFPTLSLKNRSCSVHF